MGKPTVARETDFFRCHDVMIALGKASAAATLLDMCADGSDYLQISRLYAGQDEADARDWIQAMAQDALDRALSEVADAFRKSITPEEARRQAIERTGPKAVA
jgi:hypothetical protein